MSQIAGDVGSQLMFARSQYEQNAKRKKIIIPKGTIFKNAKIQQRYDNGKGQMYFYVNVQDEKRGLYDEQNRTINENDFNIKNILQKGINFFNVQNYRIINKNGFDISEGAIVDVELNKDITESIFDEPFVLKQQTTQGSSTQNENKPSTTQFVLGQSSSTQGSTKKEPIFYILVATTVLVIGYFGYKKFKK